MMNREEREMEGRGEECGKEGAEELEKRGREGCTASPGYFR